METSQTEQKFIFLTFDLLILNLVLFFWDLLIPNNLATNFQNESMYFLHANLSAILSYVFLPLQNFYLHDDFVTRLKRITTRILVFVFLSYVLAVLLLPKEFSRLFILQYSASFYVGLILFQIALYKYLKYRRLNGNSMQRTLILENNDMGKLLRDVFDDNPMLGFKFVGFVSDTPSHEDHVLGHVADIKEIVDQNKVEMIFVTLTKCNDIKYCKDLLSTCNKLGVRMRIVPENQYWFKSRINMESYGSLVVFNPQEIPLDGLKARFFKRTFDIIFSLLVIIFIISWLFPLVFLLIKLESKGDAVFFQQRTGINNRSFNCMKFRSMRLNNDADTKQAVVGDTRITKIGNFLRKTNIDEFPQFFNVLFGQMSVVGPRPHMIKHTEQYSELIDHYKARHYVKPGITGWAQVNGYRGVTDELWKMEKRVEYDMYYLKNWTFMWDIKIIFRTVFGRTGYKNAC